MKYIGLGRVGSVINQDDETNVKKQNKGQGCVKQDKDVEDTKILNWDMVSEDDNEPDHHLEQLKIVKYDLETGVEVIHETN